TPAMEGRIPVRVLNSRRPERAGTLILGEGADDAAPEHEGRPPVRSIAHKTGARVITIVSPRMLARHGFMARIAEVFDRHATSIDMISTTEVSVSLTTGDSPARIDPLLEELREFSQVEVEERRGMVSVVGERLGESIDLVGEVFRCVAAAGAEVEMISYGATRTNLSFLVAEEMVPAAVAALHRRYFDERAGEERN
ncbi:MAG: lysine-sensitive aspartokinase 3, partial [Planctomycetota bacterium]